MPSNITSKCNVKVEWFLTFFATCMETILLFYFLINLSKISSKYHSQIIKYNSCVLTMTQFDWLRTIMMWNLSVELEDEVMVDPVNVDKDWN